MDFGRGVSMAISSCSADGCLSTSISPVHRNAKIGQQHGAFVNENVVRLYVFVSAFVLVKVEHSRAEAS